MSAESAALVAGLADLDLTADEREYLDLHAPRYERLLDGLRECVDGLGAAEADVRILDVGPALQTVLIRRAFPAATVDTAGLPEPARGAGRGRAPHRPRPEPRRRGRRCAPSSGRTTRSSSRR